MSHRVSMGLRLGATALLAMALAGAYAAAESSSAVVARYDKNRDRTLDWNEVASAAVARFAKLDQDGDGTIDRAAARSIIRTAAFKAADADRDGTLSKSEYLARVKQRVTETDADHDRTLSAKELHGAPGTI